MKKWLPEFERAGIRIVVLTTDSPEKNLRVAKRLDLPYAILSDPNGQVLKKIGMWDARWKIAAYGYYVLGQDLEVLSHRSGYHDMTSEDKKDILATVGRVSPK